MSDPIFYRKPAALSREAHGSKRFRKLPDLGFARAANAIPIGASEVGLAARHFPLVFAAAEPGGLVAIVGIENGKNLFVGADGQWAENVYIPAFVRRYPFAFAEQGDQLILCIDEAAGTLDDADGETLFDAAGKPTKFVDDVLAFNREFQFQSRVASDFAAAAKALGLLVDNRADINTRDGRRATLEGFRVIDREKYDALPDATFLDWRKRGWLDIAAAHFVSMNSWQDLLARG
jgi:hypothetical protein